MIVSRAPLRISLAGGGSDLPSFYQQGFGQVFSFAIDKYVYIACHELFSGGIRLSYSKTENVVSSAQIEHPLIRESLKFLNFDESIEIGSFADVPGSGTGLGSSSAFCVALVNAIKNYKGVPLDKEFLAQTACTIEIERCRDPIGKQDQYASAFGGINYFRFNQDESVDVQPIKDTETTNFLEQTLLLYYLGSGRNSSSILFNQDKLMKSKQSAIDSVTFIRDLVPPMMKAVYDQNPIQMSTILNDSWIHKKSLEKQISSPEIDQILDTAIEAGALGGKVVGAGGGGFLLLVVDPAFRNQFVSNFSILRQLTFSISSSGAEIVYSDESD
jgi:D-glycero-alpha-D-manno-heptose-7-phosphate kinase